MVPWYKRCYVEKHISGGRVGGDFEWKLNGLTVT
jgi:hypothetical protein